MTDFNEMTFDDAKNVIRFERDRILSESDKVLANLYDAEPRDIEKINALHTKRRELRLFMNTITEKPDTLESVVFPSIEV